MKHVKFNKTLCGVDFLLNVIDVDASNENISKELYAADFFQIIFVKEGNGELILDDQEIALKPQQVLFISKNQRYQWRIKEADFTAKVLVFQEDFLNDFFSDQYFTYRLSYFYQNNFPLSLIISLDSKDKYCQQLKEIKQELTQPKTDSVHLIRSILYYLLAKLNRAYAETYHLSDTDQQNNMAYHFRKLVEENIRNKQRVDDYAEMMKTNRITLNKAVKKQFQQTANEFLKGRIVHEIKMDLIYSNQNIDQISMKYHFSEANHLTRFFKTQTGLTPTSFRKDYQNGSL